MERNDVSMVMEISYEATLMTGGVAQRWASGALLATSIDRHKRGHATRMKNAPDLRTRQRR